MKVLLKDLMPGDIFEYVDQTPSYRKGKFRKLEQRNCYLEPSAKHSQIFILDLQTNRICNHRANLCIALLLKTKENNVENKMGHFEGWKFGVPVKVSSWNFSLPYLEDVQLVYEDKNTFRVVGKGFSKTYMKGTFSYELISHKYSAHSPRYPVCSNPDRTAFCNEFGRLTSLGTTSEKLQPYPIATLNIDGKTIELSAETTAELKNKLGI